MTKLPVLARRALMPMLLAPVLAWAGGTAVLDISDGEETHQVTYEYDGGNVRMSMAANAEGYTLIRGGTPYAVVTGDQTMVIDLSQTMQMIGSMTQMPEGPTSGVEGFVSLVDTGRSETVAGIKGKVHMLTYVEDGEQKTAEVVLSSDRRVQDFSKAMMQFAQSMVKASGREMPKGSSELEARLMSGELGMLRMGSEMRVSRLDSGTPAASRFELPAAPTQMPSLDGLFGAGGGVGASAEADGKGGGFSFGSLLGDKARRQQERVEQRSDAEVDEASDRAVDKVLDKAFDKLFGG